MRSMMTMLALTLALGCDKRETTPPDEAGETGTKAQPDEPDPNAAKLVLRAGKVMTATGTSFAPGAVLIVGDEIAAVGTPDEVGVPEGAKLIELGAQQVITPGIIDTHSHMGVYASPGLTGHNDGNEIVAAISPQVRAEDGFWPQDPQLGHALAGGITSAQILPGSANLIGGRSFTIKLRPHARSAEDMRFEGAPAGLKMACGENPKRVYGEKGGPSTRMGNVAGYRKAFEDAVEANGTPTSASSRSGRPAPATPSASVRRPSRVGTATQRASRTRRSGPSRRLATSGSRRWSACSTERSSCTCTATAPTRCR
jgi:hypothetical protein